MSTKTERNTQVTTTSEAVAKDAAKAALMDYLSLNLFSGNMQRIMWKALDHLIGEDLKNSEWSSVESDVLDRLMDDVSGFACDGDIVVGLDAKAFENVTTYFDEVVLPKFYKAFPKEVFEAHEWKRVNAYEADLTMTAGDSAKYTFRISTLEPKGSDYKSPLFLVKAPWNRYEAGKISHELVRDNWQTFHLFLKETLAITLN